MPGEPREEQATILVVDDEKLVRTLLCETLKESGYRALPATSGAEALRLVAEHRPDAILLDIVMPEMDGFETCARLRQLPGTEHLPIIVVTALENAETVNRAYAAGATDYLPKPVNKTLLRHHLRYVLRAAAIQQSLAEHREQLRLAGQVFNRSSELIAVTTRDFALVECNPAFCRLVSVDHSNLVGKNLRHFLSLSNGEDLSCILDALCRGDGCWQGETRCRRHDGESFPTLTAINAIRDDEGVVARFIVMITDLSQLRETQSRLQRLSQYDPLTGLPNRHLFDDRLQQALYRAARTGEVLAVVVFDLDNFNEVNETLGHRAGDLVLKQVAGRLTAQIRRSDTFARLGSDEFALILPQINSVENGALVASRILDTLTAPFAIDGHNFYLTASIGIALVPADGIEAIDLAKRAETAMHFAKEQGRNGYQFFSTAMNHKVQERVALKDGIRRGLHQHEFLLHYQPKYDSRTTRCTGVEALARWQHPERGLVPPLQFIPLAEETGLIVPLGAEVLRLACRQNVDWRRRGLDHFRVAVNLSACQFRSGDLVATVTEILDETGLPPDGLELEITESALLQDTERTGTLLKRLRELGIRIALDDFGTGYSSLSYLRRFPLDVLKIDYTFVKKLFQNEEDTAIVRAIIAMAKGLHLTTVAEGVETEAQRTFLVNEGCDELQGYIAGMPQAAEEVERYLPRSRSLNSAQ